MTDSSTVESFLSQLISRDTGRTHGIVVWNYLGCFSFKSEPQAKEGRGLARWLGFKVKFDSLLNYLFPGHHIDRSWVLLSGCIQLSEYVTLLTDAISGGIWSSCPQSHMGSAWVAEVRMGRCLSLATVITITIFSALPEDQMVDLPGANSLILRGPS
jgi:hypothetical protein